MSVDVQVASLFINQFIESVADLGLCVALHSTASTYQILITYEQDPTVLRIYEDVKNDTCTAGASDEVHSIKELYCRKAS